MHAKRERHKPRTGKDLIAAVVGEDPDYPRIGSLKRVLRTCIEHPEIHAALSRAIVDDWQREMNEMFPQMPPFSFPLYYGESEIKDAIKLVAECERALLRDGIECLL